MKGLEVTAPSAADPDQLSIMPFLSLQVCYRVEWAKFQERERKKEEEEKEKERVAYAQIDWHDFVVVETVDFQPNEQGRSVTPDE